MSSPLAPLLIELGFQEGPRRLTPERLQRATMPEGDTIAYAAAPDAPGARGRRCPMRSARRSRATRIDRWPRAAGRPRGERGPHPRQAPVPPLRGRSGDALAPADDRRLGRVRAGPALAALAAAGLAGAASAAAHEVVAVRRAGARAADRGAARAPTSAWPGSAPTCWPRSSTPTRFLRAAARRRPDARRSATRCSTSATSPGSATSGSPRAAGQAGRRPVAAGRRGDRRRGALRVIERLRPRMRQSGARRAAAGHRAVLPARRRPVPALRHADPRAWPGRRQPH